MDFVKNLVRYRDKLVNLNYLVDETYLYTKFHNALYVCFTDNLRDRKHQDNLYQQMYVDVKHKTWEDIVRLVSANRRNEYAIGRPKLSKKKSRRDKQNCRWSTLPRYQLPPTRHQTWGKLKNGRTLLSVQSTITCMTTLCVDSRL
jgi:hypothetical protein